MSKEYEKFKYHRSQAEQILDRDLTYTLSEIAATLIRKAQVHAIVASLYQWEADRLNVDAFFKNLAEEGSEDPDIQAVAEMHEPLRSGVQAAAEAAKAAFRKKGEHE